MAQVLEGGPNFCTGSSGRWWIPDPCQRRELPDCNRRWLVWIYLIALLSVYSAVIMWWLVFLWLFAPFAVLIITSSWGEVSQKYLIREEKTRQSVNSWARWRLWLTRELINQNWATFLGLYNITCRTKYGCSNIKSVIISAPVWAKRSEFLAHKITPPGYWPERFAAVYFVFPNFAASDQIGTYLGNIKYEGW